jgi:hypothetical protein
MSAQLILGFLIVGSAIIWLAQLFWLYRQAETIGRDPFAQVSGAAVFFVLAVPVALYAPHVVDRVATFWEWVFSQDIGERFRGNSEGPAPRLIVGGKTIPLTGDRLQIGRFENNDLVLDHPTVSAYHAEIVLRPDGRHELQDRDSRNGSRINGTVVRSAVLRHGDQITLGALTIHYLVNSATEQALQSSGLSLRRRR